MAAVFSNATTAVGEGRMYTVIISKQYLVGQLSAQNHVYLQSDMPFNPFFRKTETLNQL